MDKDQQLQGILRLLMVGASAEAAELVLVPAADSQGPTRRVMVGRGEIMSDRVATTQVLLINDATNQPITTAWIGSVAAFPVAGPSAEEGWIAVAHHGIERFADQTLKSLEVAAQLIEDHLDSELEQAELNRLSEHLLEDQDGLREVQDQLKQANRRLSHRATTDSLTGLANRRKIQETLASPIQVLPRPAEVLDANRAIAVIDLDHFKTVNDSHGHGIGDALLTAVAGRIQSHIGHADVAGRWGGDEFIIVFGGPISLSAAQARVAALGQALREPYVVDGQLIKIRASIGVALEWPNHDPVTTIAAADREMYKDKRLGES